MLLKLCGVSVKISTYIYLKLIVRERVVSEYNQFNKSRDHIKDWIRKFIEIKGYFGIKKIWSYEILITTCAPHRKYPCGCTFYTGEGVLD